MGDVSGSCGYTGKGRLRVDFGNYRENVDRVDLFRMGILSSPGTPVNPSGEVEGVSGGRFGP